MPRGLAASRTTPSATQWRRYKRAHYVLWVRELARHRWIVTPKEQTRSIGISERSERHVGYGISSRPHARRIAKLGLLQSSSARSNFFAFDFKALPG